MKIVIIGPNVGMGGVERASSNIANGLQNAGHEVTYLALIPEKHFFDLHTNYVEPIGFNENKMSLFKTLCYIRKNIKNLQPDKIIAFTKFYSSIANAAIFFTKYNIIVTERSSPLYQWPKKIELFSKVSFLFKKAGGVISQTAIASKYHKNLYGKTRYAIIPNVVRQIELYPEIKRENIILAVGRFHDDCKGFDLLVKAFNLLEDKSWRLVFVGGTKDEGQYLLDMATPAARLNIDFLGSVKNMDKIYAKAGIFVMPSRSEGFPNALAEAMAAGCCCISFDFIAGPRDLIDHNQTGLIVENGNIAALSKTIDELISKPEIRIKFEKASTVTRSRFCEDTIIKKYIDFL
jgi:GalNAc-alpha-(1->4)-GalNAc-alpha-(1->3)-diNAcBac-PP-undecaprenol alpha-1,4-N-acetyl-D-galactosaminyltransferase